MPQGIGKWEMKVISLYINGMHSTKKDQWSIGPKSTTHEESTPGIIECVKDGFEGRIGLNEVGNR